MKLIEIWKRIGKQPLRVTQRKEAVVFVNGEEYQISDIRYESGKFIGFEVTSEMSRTNKTEKYKYADEEDDMWESDIEL